MQNVLTRVNSILAGISGWLMMSMVALLTIDIIWRVFGKPLLGMAELSVFVMMGVVYLGFAGCEEHGQHVRLEFLESRLSPRHAFLLRKFLQILVVISMMIFYLAVFRDAAKAFATNDSIEGMVSLPIWPTKFVMVFGMTIYLAQVIAELFAGPGHDREPPGVSGGDF